MPPITDALPDIPRELRFFPTDNTSPQHLSREQIHQYNHQGYVFPLDVYSAAEAAANRVYFDELMAKATAAGWDAYSINGWQLRSLKSVSLQAASTTACAGSVSANARSK